MRSPSGGGGGLSCALAAPLKVSKEINNNKIKRKVIFHNSHLRQTNSSPYQSP